MTSRRSRGDPGEHAAPWGRPLIPLAIATFAVGTDAFVIAGLLPAIAADLDVSIPSAGQLVTVFALTLAIAAPVLSWLASGLDRRKALHVALVIFILGNVATALSPTYAFAMTSRVVTALGAATITATASSAAVVLAPDERRGRALAVVIGGLTVSTALGVPAGHLLGATDWRLTLWAVGGLGVVAALGLVLWMPSVVLPSMGLAARLAPLRSAPVVRILAVTTLIMAGHYTVYTYIGSVTAGAVPGQFPQALTLILFAWGVGVFSGNLIAGRLADERPVLWTTMVALLGGAAALTLSPLVVNLLLATLVWAVAWGITDGMVAVIQQHRLVAIAPASAPLLLGLNSSAIYVGVGLGGALGALAQNWMTPALLGLPAGLLAVVSCGVALADLRGRRQEQPAAGATV